jgi:hypothetical protein
MSRIIPESQYSGNLQKHRSLAVTAHHCALKRQPLLSRDREGAVPFVRNDYSARSPFQAALGRLAG